MRWLFVLMFGGLGLMLLVVGAAQFFLQKRLAANARPVQAVIIRSEVIKSVSKDTDTSLTRNTSTTTWSPEVAFRYEVNGIFYESDMLRPNIIGTGFASQADAAAEIAAFPAGARVSAFVDEAHPDKAFLLMETGAGPVVFMLVAPFVLAAAWASWRFL